MISVNANQLTSTRFCAHPGCPQDADHPRTGLCSHHLRHALTRAKRAGIPMHEIMRNPTMLADNNTLDRHEAAQRLANIATEILTLTRTINEQREHLADLQADAARILARIDSHQGDAA